MKDLMDKFAEAVGVPSLHEWCVQCGHCLGCNDHVPSRKPCRGCRFCDETQWLDDEWDDFL